MRVTYAMLAACSRVGRPTAATASRHREAPAIANDPAADNTDLYAFVTPGTHDTLHIVSNWIPLEEPSGGPNFHRFSEQVLYEVKMARGADSLEDAITYQFRFSRLAPKKVDPADPAAGLGGGKEFFIQLAGSPQVMNVWRIDSNGKKLIGKKIPVAPPNIGPRTDAVAYQNGGYDDAYAASFISDLDDGSKVWAGPRDDGFYVDLGGIFDLANLRAQASRSLTLGLLPGSK